MSVISENTLNFCRKKLLETKAELINRIKVNRDEYSQRDQGGDEADASVSLMAENQFLSNQDRMKSQLIEIDYALDRIEKGKFGICEETEEPIEEARLLALPWTRLSIEGAEFREEKGKRYAT